jgi:hypothetical protein
MDQEVDDGDTLHVASGGMGAAVNCNIPLVNVDDAEGKFTISNSGVSSQSPGAGSFTPYHSRMFEATKYIPPGMELFASYGESYFETRPQSYGYLPFPRNYKHADRLLHKFYKILQGLAKTKLVKENAFLDDIWDLLKGQAEIWNTSRTLQAFPEDHTMVEPILRNGGTAQRHFNSSIRDLDWLESNGACMDNIRDGVSTIPHAGRGAFANRPIGKGDIVSPAPLIHIPNRSIMTMYSSEPLDKDGLLRRDTSSPVHQQLLLNYCFGHEESTLLLCPYGLLTNLINHSKERANTKIVWSSTMRHEEWKTMPIEEWGTVLHTGLSFDYVALRDINEGDEILLDYGDAWDFAWKKHVREFKPPRENYTPGFELNNQMNLTVRTMHELSYEGHGVHVYCRNTYLVMAGIHMTKNATYWDWKEPLYPCRVVRRTHDDSYVAEVFHRVKNDTESILVTSAVLLDLPRDAFYFRDAFYQRDHHQEWSFRHDVGIPESLFPIAWKNRPKEEGLPKVHVS